jgi:hypothetical protein
MEKPQMSDVHRRLLRLEHAMRCPACQAQDRMTETTLRTELQAALLRSVAALRAEAAAGDAGASETLRTLRQVIAPPDSGARERIGAKLAAMKQADQRA